MGNRNRIIALILIMASIAITVTGVVFVMLYNAAFDQQRDRLLETARSQARLIEAVARFDAQFAVPSDDPFALTLYQVQEAHREFGDLGETVEIVFAKLDGDNILFLSTRPDDYSEGTNSLPTDSQLAEPMRRALMGESGWVVGLDYREKTVLAAFEYIDIDFADIQLGLVAKIEMREIRQPFIDAGLVAGAISLVLVLGGAVLFVAISNPLLRNLEESERRYKELFEGVDDAVIVYSLDGRFLDCNLQALKKLGYSRAEFLQMSVIQILRSDNDSLTASVVMKMQYGGHVMLETVHVAKDGLEIPVETNSRIIEYRGQRTIMMVARDITERKRSEEALRNLQERLQSILNYAPMYIHIVDLDDRYLIANPLYAAFFRVRSNDIAGKHLRDVIPEDHAAENVVQNAKIRETGHPASFEEHFAFSNDTILVLETTKFPILDEQGQLYAVGAVTANITERRKAESERAGFDQILESTLNEIYVFDAKTLYFVRVNQGAQKNLGYSTDELRGMTPLFIKPEFDVEMFEERLQPLRNGEKEQIRFTTVHKRKDGSLYPVEVYVQLSEYQLAPVFVAIILDITEREKAEKTLERRLEFEKIVTNVSTNFINCPIETIDEGITATLEEIAKFVGANRSSLFLFSDDMKTMTNTHEWCADPADSQMDLLQEIPANMFGAYFETLKRLEAVVIGTLDDMPPDGSPEREWAKEHGFRALLFCPVIVEESLYGTVGFYGEVDENYDWPEDFILLLRLVSDSFVGALKRKEAEEVLQASKEYAVNLIKTANVMIIGLGKEGNIQEYNETAEKISGYTRQELEGKNWFEVLVPRDKYPDVWEEFSRLTEGGLPIQYENPILTKDGKERIISWRNSVLLDHGETAGTISFGMDITATKNAEKDLRKHSEDLARSNAELERFAYVASHDLQEPLRMVASYTQLLAKRYEGQLDSDADDFIHFAVDGATRMQRLIDDLLSYSRVGTRGGNLESIDCNAVLEETLLDINNLIRESGATVTYDPLPVIEADAIQLGQLFQNLIGNAIKFRSEDTPRVHVSAKRVNGEWVFSIKDNGIGINEQYYDRIFEVFQRLHTRDEYPGTGIGLAMCKKIVERHGGKIWIDSKSGEGSTFLFTLPSGA